MVFITLVDFPSQTTQALTKTPWDAQDITSSSFQMFTMDASINIVVERATTHIVQTRHLMGGEGERLFWRVKERSFSFTPLPSSP